MARGCHSGQCRFHIPTPTSPGQSSSWAWCRAEIAVLHSLLLIPWRGIFRSWEGKRGKGFPCDLPPKEYQREREKVRSFKLKIGLSGLNLYDIKAGLLQILFLRISLSVLDLSDHTSSLLLQWWNLLKEKTGLSKDRRLPFHQTK